MKVKAGKVYQFKISLRGICPSVWRRIQCFAILLRGFGGLFQ